MTARRRAAAIAAAGLLALLLAGISPDELRRRAIVLARFAPKELAVRRLGGSATAFDRRYFSFLENARRSLPPGTAGVVIDGAPADDAHVHLAAYQLAPLPVAFAGAGAPPPGWPPPPGWLVAVYGGGPPAGKEPGDQKVVARFPEGVLIGRP